MLDSNSSAMTDEFQVADNRIDIFSCDSDTKSGRLSHRRLFQGAFYSSHTDTGSQDINVEFVIRDYNKPMGVATYTTTTDAPEELRRTLPLIDELKKLL